MTPTAALPRQPPGRPRVEQHAPNIPQRIVFGVALAFVLGLGLVAGAAFLWPSGTGDDLRFNVGSLSYFPPGTVTTPVRGPDGSLTVWTWDGQPSVEPPPSRAPRTFHVVRLESGELFALSARPAHPVGCTVPYRPDFTFNNREGWFRDPCLGATYDMAGYRVFGPPPRSLDRFAVEVRGGNVYVDLADVTPGPRTAPPGYEFQTGGVMGPLNGGP